MSNWSRDGAVTISANSTERSSCSQNGFSLFGFFANYCVRSFVISLHKSTPSGDSACESALNLFPHRQRDSRTIQLLSIRNHHRVSDFFFFICCVGELVPKSVG